MYLHIFTTYVATNFACIGKSHIFVFLRALMSIKECVVFHYRYTVSCSHRPENTGLKHRFIENQQNIINQPALKGHPVIYYMCYAIHASKFSGDQRFYAMLVTAYGCDKL